MGLMQFLRPRLFVPLGIERVHWETCPRGLKRRLGLYLCPEDMAKNRTADATKRDWENRRLISSQFIDEMTSKRLILRRRWESRGMDIKPGWEKRPGSYLFNGILGQNIIVMPDVSMVIVTTGGMIASLKPPRLFHLSKSILLQFVPLPGNSALTRNPWQNFETLRLLHITLTACFTRRKRLFLPWGEAAHCLRNVLLDGKTYEVTPCGTGCCRSLRSCFRITIPPVSICCPSLFRRTAFS